MSCSKDEDIENIDEDSKFTQFSKTLLKSFILITTILVLLLMKNKYITKASSIFQYAMFVIISTILLSLLGFIDSYIYTNVTVGVGLALGMQLMQL